MFSVSEPAILHRACPERRRRNHLGSTVLMTDTLGNLTGNITYEPYGETASGNVATDRKFTGQRLDETGLYFYNARYYDATIGRFISPDTIIPNPADPQAFNRYSYCLNNPLKYVDPSGHDEDWSYLELVTHFENKPVASDYGDIDTYAQAMMIWSVQTFIIGIEQQYKTGNTDVSGFSVSAGLGVYGSINVFVADDEFGNEKGYITFSFGGGTPSCSIMGYYQHNNAFVVDDFQGLSATIGASSPVPYAGILTVGYEYQVGFYTWQGHSIMVGISTYLPEVHATIDWTIEIPPPPDLVVDILETEQKSAWDYIALSGYYR